MRCDSSVIIIRSQKQITKKEITEMTNNINEKELENVTGGWQYANGSFVNYGNYIVYTVAPGDVLSGIGQRFGVSYMQIAQWNNIKNPDLISIGQKLTIYPAVIR